MPAGDAALQIRQRNRELHRAEQEQPKIKWAAFQEQRRHEELAAIRFTQKQRELQAKLSSSQPVIETFLERLKRCLQKHMRESGGTEESIIRGVFLHWDSDSSGELSQHEFLGALRSLGLVISRNEAKTVIEYYDKLGHGEMRYGPLVEDVSRGSQHFMHHPENITVRIHRPEDFIALSSRPDKRDWRKDPFIGAFLKKLRKKLWLQMRQKGDYEKTIIRRAFLHWDKDASGMLNAEELKGAMRLLGLHLNSTEADRIVHFYDIYNKGEMSYKELVEDVSVGLPSFIEHPESEGKKALDAGPDEEDLKIGGRMFTARPTARSANALVMRFQQKLRQCVEKVTRQAGGTVPMILRDAFLFWDADSSGCLDPKELKGAIGRVGLKISDDEAKQVVAYYDREGRGEIQYHELVEDVSRESQGFLTHETSRPTYREIQSARAPQQIRQILDKIAKGSQKCASKSAMKIAGSDLLHGTLLRFDATNTGRVSASELRKAMKELRVALDDSDTARVVNWYDENASRTVPYAKLVRDVFGGSSTSRVPSSRLDTARSTASKGAMLAEKARIERRLKKLANVEKRLL